MSLLEYENQMFVELCEEDGLVVLAKGLGVERLIVNLLKTYSDPGNLVLVIGIHGLEDYLINKVIDAGISPLPKVITSQIGTKERRDVYMEGGVLFVSTRILVVDMLVDRLPIELVTGMVVFRAHKILESCQEAFSLRLFRLKNKKGFVKAISANPCAFTRGFSQVQRIMRNLFVSKLYLWPRFHAVVGSSFEKMKPDVFEIHVPMTHSMQSIQMAILDLLSTCVKELKKINPSLDTDELTVENAIAKSFDIIVKYQLDPVWHQLSSKTKRLVADLKFLKSVLRYLTQYDCITFYNLLKNIKENMTNVTNISDWLFLDAAETLFVHAKERLYCHSQKKKKQETESNPLKLESNPKWNALSDVLKEISEEVIEGEKEMVLIVVEDEGVSHQLSNVLSNGSEAYLTQLYNKFISKSAKTNIENVSSKRKQGDSEELEESIVDDPSTLDIELDLNVECEDNILLKCSNLIVEFYTLRNTNGSHTLFQTLMELHKLQYIVLYDGEMEIIRRIELHQACNLDTKLKVYFLVYSGSAEEQCYLTTLRKEKEAFEFLIKEKAHMVLPSGIDGKSGDHPDLIRGSDSANETVNSRRAGGQSKTAEVQKIIVDMREFRSELPSLIHRRNIEVVPVTLEVGDYVLTPNICVERKSVSDLIGSLNSGRLYTQAQAMCRLYKQPILLIEFDEKKAFSLQSKYYTGSNSPESVTSKLILLTLHFPALRILWCASPYSTSEMFELLKLNRPQPNVEEAMLLKTEDSNNDFSYSKFNPVALDFVSKMPGLNSKNMWPIMNKITSIADIAKYSEEELCTTLQNSLAAKLIYNSVHLPIVAEQSSENAKGFKKQKKQTMEKYKEKLNDFLKK